MTYKKYPQSHWQIVRLTSKLRDAATKNPRKGGCEDCHTLSELRDYEEIVIEDSVITSAPTNLQELYSQLEAGFLCNVEGACYQIVSITGNRILEYMQYLYRQYAEDVCRDEVSEANLMVADLGARRMLAGIADNLSWYMQDRSAMPHAAVSIKKYSVSTKTMKQAIAVLLFCEMFPKCKLIKAKDADALTALRDDLAAQMDATFIRQDFDRPQDRTEFERVASLLVAYVVQERAPELKGTFEGLLESEERWCLEEVNELHDRLKGEWQDILNECQRALLEIAGRVNRLALKRRVECSGKADDERLALRKPEFLDECASLIGRRIAGTTLASTSESLLLYQQTGRRQEIANGPANSAVKMIRDKEKEAAAKHQTSRETVKEIHCWSMGTRDMNEDMIVGSMSLCIDDEPDDTK